VAVVGASNDPTKRGHQVIRLLLEDGFRCPIFPVSLHEHDILGLPAYPSLEAIGAEIDLVYVAVPSQLVPDIIASAAAVGAAGAVVVAAGFKETGPEGEALDRRVIEAAKSKTGDRVVRIIGPNTSGMFNLHHRLNLVGMGGLRVGHLAMLSQSGNVGVDTWNRAIYESRIGFSIYVGVGNESDLMYHEYLPYLRADDATLGIAMYVEGFRNGRAFVREAIKTTPLKPIVLLKAARTHAGGRAALSHTGALAGSPLAADGALRQAGVVTVERSDELLPVAETLLAFGSMPGARVAIVADGGGQATIAADALTRYGLAIPELSGATQKQLRGLVSPAGTTRNPVDVAGATDRNPARLVECISASYSDSGIDAVLLVSAFGGYGARFGVDALTQIEERAAIDLIAAIRRARKPLVLCSMYAPARPPIHDMLRESGVPVYSSIEIGARCLRALNERGNFLSHIADRSDFDVDYPSPPARSARPLLEPQARRLLESAGVNCGPWLLATSPEEAASYTSQRPTLFAMKIVSRDVGHKSDAGGVMLNVRGGEEARCAYAHLVERVRVAVPKADVTGVLISPMIEGAVELIVGVVIDPSFGPLITVGLGGALVEVIRDLAWRLVPVTRLEAEEMVNEVRGQRILDGYRGSPAVDRGEVADLLVRVSDLVVAHKEIVELDINPLLVKGAAMTAADARLVVSS